MNNNFKNIENMNFTSDDNLQEKNNYVSSVNSKYNTEVEEVDFDYIFTNNQDTSSSEMNNSGFKYSDIKNDIKIFSNKSDKDDSSVIEIL